MLPTRHVLSSHLLESEYLRVQGKVYEVIQKADCLAIISDGWSNVRGEATINCIISAPKPVFVKSTDTKDEHHTKELIANEIKSVVGKIGSHEIFALVTDNAANMKGAWSLINEDFPHITGIGRAAHALSLLLSDVMSLRTMENVDKQAKMVIKCVKRRTQIILATFS